MTRPAMAAILGAVALGSLAVVAVFTWLDEEPFAADFVSQEFTFVPMARGSVSEALSIDGQLLRHVDEVRLGKDHRWTSPSKVDRNTAQLEQLDLLPPEPGCGTLNVALASLEQGRSLLRLLARSDAEKRNCRSSWQLIIGFGLDIPNMYPIENGNPVEVVFREPGTAARVFGEFGAAALRTGQLLRMSGEKDSPQTLANGSRMSGKIQVLRLAAEPIDSPGGGARLALATRVFAPSSAKMDFSGYDPRRHQVFQRLFAAIGVVAGAVGFAMQLIGLFSKDGKAVEQAATPDAAEMGPPSGE